MTNPDETAALVTRLETILRRLEVGNTEFPGACAACLQDVATAGHLPSCFLAGALEEVRTWRSWLPGPNGLLGSEVERS